MANLPWKTVKEYDEITFKVHEGVARIAFNRPEVRNAFTPKTVDELWEALITCHESQDIGVVLITGEGPSPKFSTKVTRLLTKTSQRLSRAQSSRKKPIGSNQSVSRTQRTDKPLR